MQIFEPGWGKLSSLLTWKCFGSEAVPGKSHDLQDKNDPGGFCRSTSKQRKESS
jgi:hypothetical protein